VEQEAYLTGVPDFIQQCGLSVDIAHKVTTLRLDDREIGVRFPAGEEIFLIYRATMTLLMISQTLVRGLIRASSLVV